MLRGAIWPYPTPSRDVREVHKVYYSSYYQIEYSVKDTDMNAIITAVMQLVVIVMELLKGGKKDIVVKDTCNYAVVVGNKDIYDIRVSVMSDRLLGDNVACYDICRDEIYLREDIFNLLTVRELEAVILHEIGHRFDRISARSNYDVESWYLEGEYRADAFACVHGYGEELISALNKLVCMHFKIPNCISIVDIGQKKIYEESILPRFNKIREYLNS